MKEQKIKRIENLIDEIIEKAINTYINNFDENSGMSIVDWKNGYKGTIRNYDGNIIEYIKYSDFKDLYSNFKYDLEKANDTQLNNIIKYLEEEKKYTDYSNLNNELYVLEEF